MEKGTSHTQSQAKNTFSVSELPNVVALLKALNRPLIVDWAAISLYLRYKRANQSSNIDAELTPENVLECFDKAVEGQPPNYDTMMTLSFYMDYAISTKDLGIINAIHLRITGYFLDAYKRSYKFM